MKNILLLSLILASVLCGMAGTTDNIATSNLNNGWTVESESFVPCGITLTSAPGTDNQIVCINTPITDITYHTSGTTQGVTFSGLPAGVTGSWASNEATINGTPIVSGIFNYTITTNTGPCIPATSATGTITVHSNATIALTSDPGTTNQTVCINTPITNITYDIRGGGTGAGVTGLPPGVTAMWHPMPLRMISIYGTPTVAGTFNYTVTTTGPCANVTATGTITVNPDATITLTSEPGSDNQTVCLNTPIAAITYSIGGSGTGVMVAGLPQNVGGLYNAGVLAIYGTPIETGYFPYSVTATGPCAQSTATGTITVNSNATIALTSDPETTNQTVCINTPITNITYFISGAGTGANVTGLPPGVTGAYIPTVHTYRIMGTPTAAGTFNYTVTTTGGTCAQATATGTITVNPDATLAMTSPPGSNSQIVCVNTPIANITYSIASSGTGATATGLPPGVAGVYNAGVFTISGAPTGAGLFSYTVTTTGACPHSATGTITVHPDATIALTSETGTTNQTVCINTPITNITYFISGAGTGANVTGLPPGVTGAYIPTVHTYRIMGTPTAAGTFNYTVTTTGGTCAQATATGTITVNPDATIALTSAPGTSKQTVCVDTPITSISYFIGGTGTGADVSGLPLGVAGIFNQALHSFIIYGTPVVTGIFNYTVTTTGPCAQSTATGTITVNSNATIALTSDPGTTNQTVCINNPITNITYFISGAGTGANVTGLPPGVYGAYIPTVHTYRIMGTPTAAGTFNYTVTTTGGTCAQATATGTITVNPDATIVLTSLPGSNSQVVCVNTPIANITYSISGSGTGATVTGLPPGIAGVYNAGVFTISGAPTGAGAFSYTVTATGICPQSTAGTITVKPDATIALTSDPGTTNQSVCINTPITNITYFISGGGTGANVTGLPPGVTGAYIPTVHTYRIMGTPTAAGTFNYTITTTGTCVQATATGIITVNPAATITLTSAPGTDNQTICLGDQITNITYLIGGGGLLGTLTGLPAGVNWGYQEQENILTLSGSPTETGTFNFTVTTIGTTCEGTAMGTITVHPVPTIECYFYNCDEEVCINTPIDDIGFVIGGAATGAYVEGLPPGVTGMYLFDYFVIGGTPSETGLFTYTVTVTGTYCNTSFTGYIGVQAPQLPILVSAPGTDNQSVCRNNYIVPIDYLIENYTDTIHIWVHRTPPGVTHTVIGGHVIISGQPSDPTGTFDYDLIVSDLCGVHMASGTITVLPDANITLVSGSAYQTVCLGDSLTPVIYSISELATGVNVTGLPPGVEYFYSTSLNRLTLFGAPVIAGSYPYSIHATSPECEDTETGTIRADSIATITLISAPGTDNQVVCYDTPITEIIYKIGNSNNAWANGLPSGVGTLYYPSDHTLKIVGRPQFNGTFNYAVNVGINSCGSIAPVHGTIEVFGSPMHIWGPRCVRVDSAGNVYTTEPGMTNYEWNVSAGGIITAGGTSTDHTVTITWNAIGFQHVYVSGTSPNGCGQVTASPYLVWVLELPTLLNVGNIIVENGQYHCALAAQTLTVAGNGTTYLVQNGGFARFMAGQNIVFLPGLKVEPGGAIDGFIVPYCHYYCNPPYKTGIMPVEHLDVQDTISPISETPFFFAVYPNPTSGSFTLELASEPGKSPVSFHCYNLMGSLVMVEKIYSGKKHEFTLADQAPGIYLVRVTREGETALRKIIRQ